MTRLRRRAEKLFGATFGGEPDLIVRAPGRVNLIGEHTDYNDGFVLPCAIDRYTMVAVRRRRDNRIYAVAGDLANAVTSFAVNEPITSSVSAPWSNYLRGVAAIMLARGYTIAGADIAIVGDIPQGAGLSSSASLEVAIGYALAQLGDLDIDRAELARIGQRAEQDYAGCQCGIMDQLAVACGVAGHALLIDCRTLLIDPVSVPSDLALLIVHSGVSRGLVDGPYNMRRRQCETASAYFGIPHLRDVSMPQLIENAARLDPVVFQRARHVVSENARTLDAAQALRDGDMIRVGSLMAASHASMRDDFEITTPAIDLLADRLQASIGTGGGARMTGGGFGGAVLALCAQSQVDEIIEDVLTYYRTPAGTPPQILRVRPSVGVSRIAMR